jgi:16S rRNA (guanine527-N7)-methyltransferase
MSARPHNAAALPADCDLPVSRETRARLEAFVALLRRWNATINLVARDDEEHIWTRHVCDCLQLLPLIPPGTAEAIDIGSGAGFPGLVLAIAGGCRFHLIEADQRKGAFLRDAQRATGAPVTVHCTRAERAELAPAALVTARAVAPLERLLALAHPLLAPGGVCLFHKGRQVASELTDAATKWHMRVERIPSRIEKDAAILRISHVTRVHNDARS